MALATQCPHCATTFRVASDQLKLRGGIVRCGACHEIFDGNAALIDLDALAAGAPVDTAPVNREAPAVVRAPAPEPPQEFPADDAPPAAAEPAAEAAVVPVPGSEPAPEIDTHNAPPPTDETATDDAHPASAETAADVTAVVPAEGSAPSHETHTDNANPAADETAADDAQPASVETAADVTAVVPAQAGTPFDATRSATSPVPEPDSDLIYTLDFDRTFDPFGILPKAATPEAIEATDAAAAKRPDAELTEAQFEAEAEPEPAPSPGPAAPAPAPQLPVAPDLDLPIDEELIAAPLPDDGLYDPEPAAVPATASEAPSKPAAPVRAPLGSDFPYAQAASIPLRAGPRTKPGRRSKLTPTKIAPPKLRIPETDEPEFVKRSREQEETGKTRRIVMAVGAVLLLLALAAQAVATFRNVWAARFPAARPALVSACALLGCRVQLPTQIDNLAIETGELQTLGPNAYSLTTLLRNNGDLVQAWPNIELALTDANDKPLLRRVFTPAEYLAPGALPGTGFTARAEQPIKLSFELDQLKPSGYHIAVFYP